MSLTLDEKKNKWEDLRKQLVGDGGLYEEVLEQYSSWLNDFYSFFGIDDFGQAKVDPPPDNPTAEEMKLWVATNDLAYKLNFLKTNVFEKIRESIDGTFFDDDLSLVGTGSDQWPTDEQTNQESFHNSVLAPLVEKLIQDLKVILENPLIAAPQDDYFAFGAAPDVDAVIKIDMALHAAGQYLSEFPEYSLTLKKDIKPLPETSGKGPTPIFSDINLENSLDLSPSHTHYIGMLLDPKMTNRSKTARYSSPYLPVRYSPHEDPDATTWDDENYSLVEIFGAKLKQVKTNKKDSRGIIVPLGLGITVTEIVESESGTWVGFVSEDVPSLATKSNQRILYTKADYVRIRDSVISSTPDPYLSKKISNSNIARSIHRWPKRGIGSIPDVKGAKKVNPKENQNWISLNPFDVRLERYDFSEHNKKSSKKDLTFNAETIAKNPALRYSHGDYYFIRGEIPRSSEEDLIQNSEVDLEGDENALEAKKKEISADTINVLKQEAWKNLLNYLNKHHDPEESIQEQLLEKYFVVASAKVNTSSVNPNNQKVLFAIRVSYVDALPEKKKPYLKDFGEHEKDFAAGNNFAVTVRLREFNSIVANLVKKFENIKSKIQGSNTKVQNPNNMDYDVVEQIKVLKDLPNIFNRFLSRQSLPASTSADFLTSMVAEGTATKDDHIIEIGIKDNNAVGEGVRETISYVLFSPDPKKLKNLGDQKSFNLFYFDPFLTPEEITEDAEVRRSAIPLRTGIPLFREEFEGVHGSRALHLLFSYNGFKAKLREEDEGRWIEFLQNYSVPPLKIFPSLDPTKIEKGEGIDCEEIIRRLNNSGPVSGQEERRLQELLVEKECMKAEGYWSKFKNGTPAMDPSLSKASLQEVAENNDTNFLENEYVKLLYTKFFNVLDPQALVSLIMACIQKKLGIPLTAEAICEAAIVELVKSLGIEQVEQIIIANAMLSPGSELSVNALNALGAGPGEDSTAAKLAAGEILTDEHGAPITPTDLDESWNNSPVATALVVAGSTESATVIEAIKNLEKSGHIVELVPGRRPSGEGEISVPYGAGTVGKFIPGYKDKGGQPYIAVSEFYTQGEIDAEIERLTGQGYSKSEAEAELVANGMLVPSSQQYGAILSGEVVAGPLKNLGASLGGETGASIQATTQDAENWLGYMRGALSLGGLCELIVGEVLEGLENLIRDPGSFSFSNWGSSFLDRLKRRFSPPSPTMRFPDSLMTDSHMGDYGERVLKILISMVATILGQIVELLIRQALEACLEEAPGPGPEPPIPTTGAPIPLPDIQRANLPQIGDLPRADVASWIKDLMDNLSVQQLCALLRGDATKQTLYDCLTRTRMKWPYIIMSGVDSTSDIATAFKMIGETLNLEICSLIQAVNPVEDLCDAAFDYDARCAQLKMSGLTEEECQKQIDEEINDLKSKVSGMVPLLFDQTNPLSSLPSICEIEGAFQVPDGIQDTMDRVTDNMLDHVKGSLTQDLSALKFFATPPRAVLALSDKAELEKAHNIFADIKLDPETRLCVVSLLPGLNTSLISRHPVAPVYPLVYNQYLHFGGHSTFRWYKYSSGAVYRMNVIHRSPDPSVITANPFKNDAEGIHGHIGGVAPNTDHVAYTDMDLPVEVAQIMTSMGQLGGQFGASLAGTKQFLKSEKVEPLTVISMLDGNTSPASTRHLANPIHKDKPRFKEIVGALRLILKASGLSHDAQTGFDADSSSDQDILARVWLKRAVLLPAIKSEMAKMPTAPYIGKLLLTPDDVINFNGGRAVGTMMAPQEYRAQMADEAGPMMDKVMSQYSAKNPETMNKIWSLDTKLRDVRNDALTWYPMIKMFTGVNIFHTDWGPTGDQGNGFHESDGKFYSSVDDDMSHENYHAFPGKVLKLPDYGTDGGYSNGGQSYNYGTDSWAGYAKSKPIITNYYGGEVVGQLNSSTVSRMTGNQVGWKPGFLHWLKWLERSPGLVKLFRIAKNRYLNGVGPAYNEYTDHGARWRAAAYKTWGNTGWEGHTVADAFMELTVGEALGLTPDRMKKIMPNLNVNIKGIIFGESSSPRVATFPGVTGQGINVVGDGQGTVTDHPYRNGTYDPQLIDGLKGAAAGMYPLYAVFEEKSLSGKTKTLDDMVDHFKMDKDKVNQKLYDALGPTGGFVPSIAGTDVSGSLQMPTKKQQNQDFYDIDGPNSRLFNPNILLYSFPFTDVLNQNVDGSPSDVGGATLDGKATTTAILDMFKQGLSEFGLEEASELLASMDGLNKSHSLLYQNVLISISDHVTSQLEEVKDVLTIAKGKIINTGDAPVPANVIKHESQIYEEKLVLKHKKSFDQDILNLLKNIYGGDFNYQKLREVYLDDFKPVRDGISNYTHGNPGGINILPDPVYVNGAEKEEMAYKHTLMKEDGPYKLDALNFKAQMFGELLVHKFMEAHDKYYEPQATPIPGPISKEDFRKRLKYILSTYGYSSLQYAYSSQMFSKLRGSRLQNRGFMKKLWNAVLKSPLTSKADPRCLDVLNQMSLIPKSDMDETETDFFNLSVIKPEIKKIYMRSLCADVYEKREDTKMFPGTEQLGAAQISLLEGMVILLIKVYVLELCLASVISWDSFDLGDILQDEIITEIVCDNMTKDEYDIDLISYFCNDIIRKRENITDIEKYKTITSHRSALKYMIEQESNFIASTVKSIFKFSNPLTTDLSLDVLKNSDSDFEAEFNRLKINEFATSSAFSSLYDVTKEDYVISAQLPNNIYTMNYGDGHTQEFLPHKGQGYEVADQAYDSDIFGYFSQDSHQNKNLFHSLPMTHFTADGDLLAQELEYPYHDNLPGLGALLEDSIYESHKNETLNEFLIGAIDPYYPMGGPDGPGSTFDGSPRKKMQQNIQFMKYTTLQRSALGGADPWSKENFGEILFGGPLNAKLGNITINPYVRIEIETDCEQYNFKKYIPPAGNEPCEDPEFVGEINACSDVIQSAISDLHATMREDNIFNSYIDGYVPLSVWSYFYNNIFLKVVNTTFYYEGTLPPPGLIFPLKELYNKFGFKPFFKEVNFGLRLSYSTSYPIFQAEDLKFTEFMQASFYGTGTSGLKKVKSLFGQRPHSLPPHADGPSDFADHAILRELQIPIAEVERSIICHEGAAGFTIDSEQNFFSMDELGYWIPTHPGTPFDQFNLPDIANPHPEDFLTDNGREVLKFLTKTPDQFFYKHLASDLLTDLKDTPEFRLMFDHLFPMRKYMALSFMYAGEGLSKFISDPSDILDLTKDGIKSIWENLISSADYKHMPAKVSSMMEDYLMRSQGGTRGKEPDMTKQILEIIYKTPLLILKGFVEVTDPAVIIGKTIIDVAMAVQQATISAMEQALRTAKQIADAALTTAKAVLAQMKVKAGIDLAQANVLKTILKTSPTVPKALGDAITIGNTSGDIETWVLKAPSSIDAYESEMTDLDKTSWTNFKEKFDSLKSLKDEIFEAKKEIKELEDKVEDIQGKIDGTLQEAKDAMKDVFGSPFLLPGLWFSMLPSMTPYMGGIMPPGFPGGPPSTVPGMIYIALLLIDAIEEKMDDDINKTKAEPNCDSEL